MIVEQRVVFWCIPISREKKVQDATINLRWGLVGGISDLPYEIKPIEQIKVVGGDTIKFVDENTRKWSHVSGAEINKKHFRSSGCLYQVIYRYKPGK